MLIGISGEIGSGKSTLSDFIVSKYGFIEYSFAKPLKEIAMILGFEPHQLYGTQEDKLETNNFWNISAREFLQKFGTEVCRDFLPRVIPKMSLNGQTLWVRLFEKFYLDNRDKNIIISDVRYLDEAASIKKLGGYIIRIEREKFIPREIPLFVNNINFHKSETEMSHIVSDYKIINNSTKEKLFEYAQLILSQVEIRDIEANSDDADDLNMK